MKTCIDLFSGLGGFSAAFRDSPEWEVITVEINEEFDPDIRADVMDLRPKDLIDALPPLAEIECLVVLASPPCTVFSSAGNHDEWNFDNNTPIKPKAREHVALVHHTVGLIKALAPDYWFLENPTGRLKWFLGEPTGRVTYCQYGRDYMKPTSLWGSHPPMRYRSCSRNMPCHVRNREDDGTPATSSMSGDHAERSLVPYELSTAILEAVEDDLAGLSAKQLTVNDL